MTVYLNWRTVHCPTLSQTPTCKGSSKLRYQFNIGIISRLWNSKKLISQKDPQISQALLFRRRLLESCTTVSWLKWNQKRIESGKIFCRPHMKGFSVQFKITCSSTKLVSKMLYTIFLPHLWHSEREDVHKFEGKYWIKFFMNCSVFEMKIWKRKFVGSIKRLFISPCTASADCMKETKWAFPARDRLRDVGFLFSERILGVIHPGPGLLVSAQSFIDNTFPI